MVNIAGNVGSNTNIYAGWPFARLPEQARPAIKRFITAWTAGGGTQALVLIDPDGTLKVNNIYGATGKGVGITPVSYPVGR